MKLTLPAAVVMLILTSPASAEVQAGDIANATENTAAWTYLQGLTHGIEWAVAAMSESPPFCAPANLAITTHEYRQILRQEIAEDPEQAKNSAGLVMMGALKRIYLCPQEAAR